MIASTSQVIADGLSTSMSWTSNSTQTQEPSSAAPGIRPILPSATYAVRRQNIQPISSSTPASAFTAAMPAGGAVSQ